ncbi:hypothetical protein KY284_000560 [Solanum tuberosum]|nr:hypothetical protein KY284_000560 [Solanum tuberosum]
MVDQVYKDKGTLKTVMTQYAIDHRFQWKTDSYTLICVSENCGWIMKSSNINKSEKFRIKKLLNEHTCSSKDQVYCQRQATSNLVGGIIKPKLVNHKKKLTPKDIQDNVRLDLEVDVTYSFESCRSIVVVDDSQLKGTYNGTFVSTSALDGEDN